VENRNNPKDSKKKQLGQYFSNAALVDFIFQQLPAPETIRTVLDPSCGDGIFLRRYAQINTTADIYGLDIDSTAIVAGQNFEKSEKKNLAQQSKAIRWHLTDSLSPLQEFDSYCIKHSIPSSFDLIVGNPPFLIIKSGQKPYHSLLQTGEFRSINASNVNLASLFLYRFSMRLNPGGYLAFIFPRSVLHVESYGWLRTFLKSKQIVAIFDIGRAFLDVGLTQIIIILRNHVPKHDIQQENDEETIRYGLLDFNPKTATIEMPLKHTISAKFIRNSNSFSIFSGKTENSHISGAQIFQKLQQAGKENILDYCIPTKVLGTDPIARGFGFQKFAKRLAQSNEDIPLIGGRSIFCFGKKQSRRFLSADLLNWKQLNDKIAAQLYSPKILIQNLASSKIRLVVCYEATPCGTDPAGHNYYLLPLDTLTVIIPDPKYARFLVGILTSELMTYYLRDFIFIRQTLTIHVDRKYLLQLPIIHPSPIQLSHINDLVVELENYVAEQQQQRPVSDRSIPSWERPDDPANLKYSQLRDALNRAIFDLYTMSSEEIAFIRHQLAEFEQYY
jgi:tRNA1(Val) A37 N6-methylase TrmN6